MEKMLHREQRRHFYDLSRRDLSRRQVIGGGASRVGLTMAGLGDIAADNRMTI